MPDAAVTPAMPGQITVGVDATGKHYMYGGKGQGRGRKPLHLSDAVAKQLAARGLKPGNNIALSGPALQKLMGSGAVATGGIKAAAAADPKAVTNKILESHSKWASGKDAKTVSGANARLKQLLANGREQWLASGHTSAHKALAGAILGAVFGKGVKAGGGSNPNGIKIKLKLGPDGGSISFSDAKGPRGEAKFKSLASLNEAHIHDLRSHLARLTGAQVTKPQQKAVAEAMKSLEALDKPQATKPQVQKPTSKPEDSAPKRLKYGFAHHVPYANGKRPAVRGKVISLVEAKAKFLKEKAGVADKKLKARYRVDSSSHGNSFTLTQWAEQHGYSAIDDEKAEKLLVISKSPPASAKAGPAPKPEAPKASKPVNRNYTAGANQGSISFESESHRDLYDLGAKMKFGATNSGKLNTSSNAKRLADQSAGKGSQLEEHLAQKLGISVEEVRKHAFETYRRAKEQMKGLKDGEERKVKYEKPK